MSWTWDAPSGTYKNHFLSANIREQGSANSQFMKFAQPERGYGKGKGAHVTITRVMQLGLATTVTESERLPTVRPVIDTVSKEVAEWGAKIELTKFEENLTHFNIRNPFQRMLRDQIRLTMDKMVADAFKTTLVKAVATSASAITWDTDGTLDTTATANLSVAHLRDIHDFMKQTLKCPTFADGTYVGILSTKAARGIKNDAEYRDWYAPESPMPFMTGQLKQVENVRLLETNHSDALDNTIGTADVAGEAVFFGPDAVFLAEVERPELRRGLPTDLGRFTEIGWCGTLEAGNVWTEATKAHSVHFGSA